MPKFIEVSVDEVLAHRKDFSDGEGGIYKANVAPRSWNDDERSAVFTMSAETADRYSDVVEQAGIDTSHFVKNPVALFGHRSWDMPVGTWSDLRMVRSSPKRTEGKLTFTEEGVDELADRTARNVKAGVLKACSIGFYPKAVEKIMDDDNNWTYGYRFKEIELFECSVCAVPAVREALIRGAGSLKEIVEPETIEEFLEHLRANPALANMVDKGLYEETFREITGHKTTVIVPPVERQYSGMSEAQIREAVRKISPSLMPAELAMIQKQCGDDLHKIAQEEAKKVLPGEDDVEKIGELEALTITVDTTDAETKLSGLSKMFDAILSKAKELAGLTIKEPPAPEYVPEALDKAKALRERMKQLAEKEAA